MTLNDLPESWKEVVAEHFDYSINFDFLDCIADIIMRLDKDELRAIEQGNYDAIYTAVDDCLIYTSSEWVPCEYYFNTPRDIDFDILYDNLYSDIIAICNEIIKTDSN